MRREYVFAWCFFTLFVVACGDSTSQRDDAYNLDEEALTQLTGEAFTFAYPLVEHYRMVVARTNPQSPVFAADFNQFAFDHILRGPEDMLVIRPNRDTLYGGVTLDVRREAMIIGAPEIEDSRYYSVQLIDSHTHNLGYIGMHTTGNGASQFMIARLNWRGYSSEAALLINRFDRHWPKKAVVFPSIVSDHGQWTC